MRRKVITYAYLRIEDDTWEYSITGLASYNLRISADWRIISVRLVLIGFFVITYAYLRIEESRMT